MLATMIMHYETVDLTRQVLRQLREVSPIIVFDDGSQQPFAARSAIEPLPEWPSVSIMRANQNGGYVHAVNLGMARLAQAFSRFNQTEVFVWVLNSDIRRGLSRGLLDELETTLLGNPQLAAVTPAVLVNAHQQMFPGSEDLRFVTHIDWVAPLVRLSAWQQVGGFDENLRGFGCDLDFCHRARKLNWRFAVLPRRVIDHEMMGTVSRVKDSKGHADLDRMSKYLCGKYRINNVWELKD